jgi:hypothetical protein
MAVVAKLYGGFILAAWNKEIDLNSDTIKCMLVGSGYTPNQDTHDYLDDVVANELTGTGYTAGGATLANPTITYTAGTNVAKFDADDASWASSSITLPVNGSAIVYDSTPGTNATRPLICYQQTDAQVASTNGTFSVAWHSDGICAITIA